MFGSLRGSFLRLSSNIAGTQIFWVCLVFFGFLQLLFYFVVRIENIEVLTRLWRPLMYKTGSFDRLVLLKENFC